MSAVTKSRSQHVAVIVVGLVLCLGQASGCPYLENATCLCLNLNTYFGNNTCFTISPDENGVLRPADDASTANEPKGYECCQVMDSPPSFPLHSIGDPPHGGWNEMQFLRQFLQRESGFPFLATANFPREAMNKAVSTAERMLNPPNHVTNLSLAKNMVLHSGRFFLRAWSDQFCTNASDPDTCDDRRFPGVTVGQQMGGPVPSQPSGGAGQEEICYFTANGTIFPHWRHTYGFFEEFFHTIHALGIENSYPSLYGEIQRVANISVEAGDYRYCMIGKIDPDCQSCIDDWNNCIVFEWFASVAKVWYGLLQPCNLGPENLCEYKFRSRAEIKKYAPESARLISLLFPDDDWNPCDGFHIPDMCAWQPGNAWCGGPLSKEYMGPPLVSHYSPAELQRLTFLVDAPRGRTREQARHDLERRLLAGRLKMKLGH